MEERIMELENILEEILDAFREGDLYTDYADTEELMERAARIYDETLDNDTQ